MSTVKRSPQKLAAARKNLVKARAAEKAKHGKGHQTAKQLASERANLAKARSARHGHGKHSGRLGRHHGAHGLHGAGSLAPLGTYKIAATLNRKVSVRKPTGRNPKFKGRITSTSRGASVSWHSARAHHFNKRLHIRKKKGLRVAKWQGTRRRIRPV